VDAEQGERYGREDGEQALVHGTSLVVSGTPIRIPPAPD